MTILRVTVDSKKHAQLLTKLLKSVEFVKKVEEDYVTNEPDQFLMVKKILEAIEPDSLFSNINNPVAWQKKVRNEWETR